LPPRKADIAIKEPPPWFAVHKFDTENIDMEKLMETAETEWAEKVLTGVQTLEGSTWRLENSFGEKKFFSVGPLSR